jgi:hypothetical protein
VVTDARFPERWLNDRRFLLLPDAAHRLYAHALMFSVANRTDGVLHDDDLPLIPAVDPARADELVKAGLWQRDGDRWLIVDYIATQTSRDDLVVLENERRRQREKKARRRAAQSAMPMSPGTSRGMGPGYSPRTGQARTGKGAAREPNHAGTLTIEQQRAIVFRGAR